MRFCTNCAGFKSSTFKQETMHNFIYCPNCSFTNHEQKKHQVKMYTYCKYHYEMKEFEQNAENEIKTVAKVLHDIEDRRKAKINEYKKLMSALCRKEESLNEETICKLRSCSIELTRSLDAIVLESRRSAERMEGICKDLQQLNNNK